MDFILNLIQKPEFSDWLSLSAFLIATLSFIWTRKATKIAEKSLNSSVKYEEEIKRSELVKMINAQRAMIKEALLELGVLKESYDAKDEFIKNSLENYAEIFLVFMPSLEGHLQEVEHKLEGASLWPAKDGAVEFLNMLNEQEVSTSETKFAVNRCFELISDFKSKISEVEGLLSGRNLPFT